MSLPTLLHTWTRLVRYNFFSRTTQGSLTSKQYCVNCTLFYTILTIWGIYFLSPGVFASPLNIRDKLVRAKLLLVGSNEIEKDFCLPCHGRANCMLCSPLPHQNSITSFSSGRSFRLWQRSELSRCQCSLLLDVHFVWSTLCGLYYQTAFSDWQPQKLYPFGTRPTWLLPFVRAFCCCWSRGGII